MKLFIKTENKNRTMDIMIFLLVFISSYAFFMPTTYFDEIIILICFAYICITHKKIDKITLLFGVVYIVWCCVGLIFNFRLNQYSLLQMLDSIKLLFLLECVLSMKYSISETDKFTRMIQIVNIPSVVVGIINAVRYNYLHQPLLIETGTLKIIDGVLIERAGGLFGHSGPFSTICAVLFIIVLFRDEFNYKKVMKLAFWGVGLYCGRGRFPLIVAMAAIIYYLWYKISAKKRKYLMIMVIAVGIVCLYPMYKYATELYAVDIEYQVRFVALRMISKAWNNVALFGLGIGSIGNQYSMLYNYSLYQQLGAVRYGAFDWESQLAKSLLQTGIIGTILWYYPYIRGLKMCWQAEENKDKRLAIFLVLFFLADSVINKTYDLPFTLIVFVFISEQMNIKKKRA